MAGHFNFNFGGPDPLLGVSSDYSSQYKDIEQQQMLLEQRKRQLAELAEKAQAESEGKPVSQTPIWDEVDMITANMSESEFALLQDSDEFKASSEKLMAFVGALQLKAIRPIVEKSEEGRKILENHLATIKVLKNTASKKVEEELSTFKEYTEKYSHLTYEEYLKTKSKKK
jgi:DNA-binding transcriptional MerR regulator